MQLCQPFAAAAPEAALKSPRPRNWIALGVAAGGSLFVAAALRRLPSLAAVEVRESWERNSRSGSSGHFTGGSPEPGQGGRVGGRHEDFAQGQSNPATRSMSTSMAG